MTKLSKLLLVLLFSINIYGVKLCPSCYGNSRKVLQYWTRSLFINTFRKVANVFINNYEYLSLVNPLRFISSTIVLNTESFNLTAYNHEVLYYTAIIDKKLQNLWFHYRQSLKNLRLLAEEFLQNQIDNNYLNGKPLLFTDVGHVKFTS